MACNVSLKQQATTLINNVRYYWKEPPKGRFMSFKEIASYAFGGIGAYFIITLGTQLLVTATNMVVGGAIGVAPNDMYIIYLVSTIANIPLTAVRANMIDNTRGKGGKYRPYLLAMGLPTAIIALTYVWFPYEKLKIIFPTGSIFGKEKSYVVLCAVVLVLNLLLIFFYNFFNDSYTNLVHVLSPNTQERTDVLAIKSVVYSLAPSIVQFVLPLVAKHLSNNNLYDIRVYRASYPVFAVIGMLLTIVVYANTEEKIIQAKTHTIQISFVDAFKQVAKNKYFWIISFAGWIGFLEGAYGSVLDWSFSYGHTCDGGTMSVIRLITSNAAMWGMILAPICIRKFGKKRVLITINTLNIIFILAMRINMHSIFWLAACVYLNWFVGAFEQITKPSIQADIRDYQQYRSGERIDGAFSSVQTIGDIITLATASVLPAIQTHYGVYEGNGYDKPFDILDVNTGNPDLLYKMMGALILIAALGAFLNMVPYFFYDFTEKKQRSIVSVLKIRSLFEDYGNNALNNHQIVEAIDLVRDSRQKAAANPISVTKDSYKGVPDKNERKLAKKAYKDALAFNEEIDIAKFVCEELDKFDSDLYAHQVDKYTAIFEQGLDGIKMIDINAVKAELAAAKALPKNSKEEKEFRSFEIELLKKKISAKKAYDKYYGELNSFVEPDIASLTVLFDKEDELDKQIYDKAQLRDEAKKSGDKAMVASLKAEIKALEADKKQVEKESKLLQDEFAKFNRAAKPYNDAKTLLIQKENYSHFAEIEALYDQAKLDAAEEDRIKAEELAAKEAEEKAELERRRAAKAAKKNSKK